MIEGALKIERNVLECRLVPRSDARLRFTDRYDGKVVVFCSDGLYGLAGGEISKRIGALEFYVYGR
jgi:hypothetical protein